MSCPEPACRLTYEALLDDELTHLLMDSDGVTRAELVRVLQAAAAARQDRPQQQ